MIQLREIQNPAYIILADAVSDVQKLLEQKFKVYEDAKAFSLTDFREEIKKTLLPFGIHLEEIGLQLKNNGLHDLHVEIKRLFPDSEDRYSREDKRFYGKLKDPERLIGEIRTWADEHFQAAQSAQSGETEVTIGKEEES